MADNPKESGSERRIGWNEYSNLCKLLADRIKQHDDPETVVGIAHGGVIVGATVATILGKDFFPIKFSRRVNARVVRKQSKLLVPPTADLEGKSVLLIDDASESGQTLKSAIQAIRKRGPSEIITAVLVRSGAYEPQFAATYFPGRVVFPWMMDEEEADAQKKTADTKKKNSTKKGKGK